MEVVSSDDEAVQFVLGLAVLVLHVFKAYTVDVQESRV